MEETQHVMHYNKYIVRFLVCFNFQELFETKKKLPNFKEKIMSLQHICINHDSNGYAEKPIFHF